MSRHVLFPNTGIQIVELEADPHVLDRWQSGAAGQDWVPWDDRGYVLWRVEDGQALFAVDTTLGSHGEPIREAALDEPVTGGEELDAAPTGKPNIDGRYVASDAADLPVEWMVDLSNPDLDDEAREDHRHQIKLIGKATYGNPIPVTLVLDLGNTRTAGLLYERGDDVADFRRQVRPLELHPHGRPLEPDPRAMAARSVFDSAIILSDQEFPPTEPAYGQHARTEKGGMLSKDKLVVDRRLGYRLPLFQEISPARLGTEFHDKIVQVDETLGLAVTLSSPKRYFWDADLRDETWQMLTERRESTGLGETVPLAGPVCRHTFPDDSPWDVNDPPVRLALASRPLQSPSEPRYPRRAALTWMVLELLERAWAFVNSAHYRASGENGAYARILDRMIVTHPGGWSKTERLAYQEQIRKAVDIFNLERGFKGEDRLNPAITLEMGLDEATASLITYVYGAIESLNRYGDNWIELVGREHPKGGARLRAACIDIGGGTTDLVIADIADARPGAGVDLRLQEIHRESWTTAGDELVRNVLNEILLPAMARDILLLQEEHELDEFCRWFQAGSIAHGQANVLAVKKRLMHTLWVPLARRYLSADIERKDEQEVDPEREAGWLPDDWRVFLEAMVDAGLIDDVQMGSLQDSDPVWMFERRDLERVVEDVFRALLGEMGRIVQAFEVDLVVMAGKPSGLSTVEELTRRIFAMPAGRLVFAQSLYVGDWYPFPGLTRAGSVRRGTVGDPKTTVVVGLAIHHAAREGLIPYRITVEPATSRRGTCRWGELRIPTAGRSRPKFVAFQKGKKDALDHGVFRLPLKIGRTVGQSNRGEPIMKYELRWSAATRAAGVPQIVEDLSVSFRRVPSNTGDPEELKLLAVTGKVEPKDGKARSVQLADIDLRVCAILEGTPEQPGYWLDSGMLDPASWFEEDRP